MSYNVNENVSRDFKVLYQTSPNEKAALDEIVLFVYEEPSLDARKNNLDVVTNSTLCKIRTAPRKFDNYYLCDITYARIYYWSNENGPHVFKPFWKKQNGVYKMDRQEIIDKARELSKSELGFDKKIEETEIVETLSEINKMNCHFEFLRDGYWNDEDRFSSDWATGELSVHFMKDQLQIGNYKPVKFVVEAHSVVEEAFDEMKKMITASSYTLQQFVSLLDKIDKYETKFNMYILAENSEVSRKAIYMMDNKIKNYEKYNWDEEILKFIEGVNTN